MRDFFAGLAFFAALAVFAGAAKGFFNRECHQQGTGKPESLIRYVTDRPGHDARYAIDASKLASELGREPSVNFEEGLSGTIDWYLSNKEWIANVRSGAYQEYYDNMYGHRLNQ